MSKYYVDKCFSQYPGPKPQEFSHSVHKLGCPWFPSERIFLGKFSDQKEAINKAKKHYEDAKGCYYCCNEELSDE